MKFNIKIHGLFTSILLLLGLLNHGLSLKAQNDFKPETYFGIRQGVNISRVSFDPLVEQEIYSGYSAGVVFSHISQKSLGIYTELNYLQSGWESASDSNYFYSRRLNYLHLPLLTQINIGNKNSRILIHLGPSFSYLISESENTNIIDKDGANEYVGRSVKNKFDYGLCFDFGFLQKTSIGSFQLMARFDQSLNSLFETSGGAYYRTSMNQVFELSLAYLLEPGIVFNRKSPKK